MLSSLLVLHVLLILLPRNDFIYVASEVITTGPCTGREDYSYFGGYTTSEQYTSDKDIEIVGDVCWGHGIYRIKGDIEIRGSLSIHNVVLRVSGSILFESSSLLEVYDSFITCQYFTLPSLAAMHFHISTESLHFVRLFNSTSSTSSVMPVGGIVENLAEEKPKFKVKLSTKAKLITETGYFYGKVLLVVPKCEEIRKLISKSTGAGFQFKGPVDVFNFIKGQQIILDDVKVVTPSFSRLLSTKSVRKDDLDKEMAVITFVVTSAYFGEVTCPSCLPKNIPSVGNTLWTGWCSSTNNRENFQFNMREKGECMAGDYFGPLNGNCSTVWNFDKCIDTEVRAKEYPFPMCLDEASYRYFTTPDPDVKRSLLRKVKLVLNETTCWFNREIEIRGSLIIEDSFLRLQYTTLLVIGDLSIANGGKLVVQDSSIIIGGKLITSENSFIAHYISPKKPFSCQQLHGIGGTLLILYPRGVFKQGGVESIKSVRVVSNFDTVLALPSKFEKHVNSVGEDKGGVKTFFRNYTGAVQAMVVKWFPYSSVGIDLTFIEGSDCRSCFALPTFPTGWCVPSLSSLDVKHRHIGGRCMFGDRNGPYDETCGEDFVWFYDSCPNSNIALMSNQQGPVTVCDKKNCNAFVLALTSVADRETAAVTLLPSRLPLRNIFTSVKLEFGFAMCRYVLGNHTLEIFNNTMWEDLKCTGSESNKNDTNIGHCFCQRLNSVKDVNITVYLDFPLGSYVLTNGERKGFQIPFPPNHSRKYQVVNISNREELSLNPSNRISYSIHNIDFPTNSRGAVEFNNFRRELPLNITLVVNELKNDDDVVLQEKLSVWNLVVGRVLMTYSQIHVLPVVDGGLSETKLPRCFPRNAEKYCNHQFVVLHLSPYNAPSRFQLVCVFTLADIPQTVIGRTVPIFKSGSLQCAIPWNLVPRTANKIRFRLSSYVKGNNYQSNTNYIVVVDQPSMLQIFPTCFSPKRSRKFKISWKYDSVLDDRDMLALKPKLFYTIVNSKMLETQKDLFSENGSIRSQQSVGRSLFQTSGYIHLNSTVKHWYDTALTVDYGELKHEDIYASIQFTFTAIPEHDVLFFLSFTDLVEDHAWPIMQVKLHCESPFVPPPPGSPISPSTITVPTSPTFQRPPAISPSPPPHDSSPTYSPSPSPISYSPSPFPTPTSPHSISGPTPSAIPVNNTPSVTSSPRGAVKKASFIDFIQSPYFLLLFLILLIFPLVFVAVRWMYSKQKNSYASIPESEDMEDNNSWFDCKSLWCCSSPSPSATSLSTMALKEFIPNFHIGPEQLEYKEILGKGAHSIVYRALWNQTIVAVKVMVPSGLQTFETLQMVLKREVKLTRHLRHPNIVTHLGTCLKKPSLYIVTELMSLGDLASLLHSSYSSLYGKNSSRSNSPNLSPGQSPSRSPTTSPYSSSTFGLSPPCYVIEPQHICEMMLDMGRGMSYLHSMRIVHRDLKCRNLLVDDQWNVKVSDFGQCKKIRQGAKISEGGTPFWSAPEVLRQENYTVSADIYSGGVCLWECLTNQIPFTDIPTYLVVVKIATQGLRPSLKNVPSAFIDLLESCWKEDPKERPSFLKFMSSLEEINFKLPKSKHPVPYLFNPNTNYSRSHSHNHHDKHKLTITTTPTASPSLSPLPSPRINNNVK